jgi:hypothetical protein
VNVIYAITIIEGNYFLGFSLKRNSLWALFGILVTVISLSAA